MIHQQSSESTIMEVREDFMTSLSGSGDSQPTFRTAHFLKPLSNSIEEPDFINLTSFLFLNLLVALLLLENLVVMV
jgi:hypothetical protein